MNHMYTASDSGYDVLRQGFVVSVCFLDPICSLSFDGNRASEIVSSGLLSDWFFAFGLPGDILLMFTQS